MKKIKTIELFAGVGGFRIGLENASKNNKNIFEIVWSNQWEPSTKTQHASDIYIKRFGKSGHSNEDISKVNINDIPNHDLLVGGFPCQDYSVASTLKNSGGIIGKKGVLWWEIHRILSEKNKERPKYLLLENVDRLLKSPAKQRGRDFALMLASLSDLGYAVEWRVINAADYGMPQRRRRVFIIGYHNTSSLYKQLENESLIKDWIYKDGILARSFPIKKTQDLPLEIFAKVINGNLVEITKDFKPQKNKSPFYNSGVMINRKFYSQDTTPEYNGKNTLLKDILLPEEQISDEFFINDKNLKKWEYLKGSKKEKRISSTGFEYNYSEGSMIFPDDISRPSRTIITGEGGSSPSRFKHVVKTKSGRLRRLTPIELERLNMFPDDHTKEASDTKRAFFMGNALVVGIVEKIGKELLNRID